MWFSIQWIIGILLTCSNEPLCLFAKINNHLIALSLAIFIKKLGNNLSHHGHSFGIQDMSLILFKLEFKSRKTFRHSARIEHRSYGHSFVTRFHCIVFYTNWMNAIECQGVHWCSSTLCEWTWDFIRYERNGEKEMEVLLTIY